MSKIAGACVVAAGLCVLLALGCGDSQQGSGGSGDISQTYDALTELTNADAAAREKAARQLANTSPMDSRKAIAALGAQIKVETNDAAKAAMTETLRGLKSRGR